MIHKIRRIYLLTPFENKMAKRGTRFISFAELLFRNGYDVEYITTDYSHSEKRYFSQQEIEKSISESPYKLTVLHIKAYHKNISLRRLLSNILTSIKYFQYLSRVLQNTDILLLPSRPVELISCVALLGWLKKCKIVLDVRDIWPDMLTGVSKFHKFIFTVYCNIQLFVSMKQINRFMHIAPSFVGWIRRYVPSAKSIFLPPGYDSLRWRDIAKKDTLHNDKEISLVFVGLLQRQLDIMPVLEALVKRKTFKLYIIGDSGTGERYNTVQKFIARNKMDNVYMLGRMNPVDVVKHLERKDIGIVPMISSSIPNKVFDYIAAYMPIISLGANDTSEFVKNYQIGWLAPFDAEKVGELLDSLTVGEINKKIELVKEIREEFSRDNLYVKFLEIIKNIEKGYI